MIRIDVYGTNDSATTFTEEDFEELNKEPKKKPYRDYGLHRLHGLYFHSKNSPNVYKLSGDLLTFDKQDIEFNNRLPQRILNNYLCNQKKKYIDELTNKDIQKSKKSKDELVGRIEEEFVEIPKPPPKWRKFADKDGDIYYYNLVTKVSQWSKPDNFKDD